MFDETELATLRKQWQLAGGKTPVIGITGTGGAGKSSVTDELLNRFLQSLPGDAHRRDLGRPHPSPHRWRAAGRPHPHELAALARASTCARWPRAASTWRPTPCSRTASRFLKGAGLRPGHRRDRRHRPERFRDRRPGRFPDVRDDQRFRRGQPARKDRHARFRRTRRAEQVRQARRRRRAARRAQAVEAQPRRLHS